MLIRQRLELNVTVRVSLAFLVAVALAAQQPYSVEKEAALGARLAQDVRKSTIALESPVVRDYVEKIGERLSAQLSSPPFNYSFSVIADDRGGPAHEPLSVPGGFIFVPASLILTARNDAEFAGMLAPAMAHVAERHGTRQAARGQVATVGSVPVIFLGGWISMGDSEESLIPTAFRSIKHRFETEADVLAVKMASGAGYDPEALVRYIGRTQPRDSLESRIARLQNAIGDLPLKTYSARADGEFARLQDEVRRATVR